MQDKRVYLSPQNDTSSAKRKLIAAKINSFTALA